MGIYWFWQQTFVDVIALQDAGFQFAFDAIRVKFKPSAADMQKAEECGTDLAQALLKKRRKDEKQSISQPKTGTVLKSQVSSLNGLCQGIGGTERGAENMVDVISHMSSIYRALLEGLKKTRTDYTINTINFIADSKLTAANRRTWLRYMSVCWDLLALYCCSKTHAVQAIWKTDVWGEIYCESHLVHKMAEFMHICL